MRYITRQEACSRTLLERERLVAHRKIPRPTPQYRIVFEKFENQASIKSPAPMFLAMLMHGDIVPPIEVFLRDAAVRRKWTAENLGQRFSWKRIGGATHPYAAPMDKALTEEEAMEFILMKDCPPRIWSDPTRNRPLYYICKVDQIPTDRTFRDSWRLAA